MGTTLIAAVSENNVIGKDGDLPWPKIWPDLKRFQELTMGHPVIVGRKTYESFGEFAPLKGRPHQIVTKQKEKDLKFDIGYIEDNYALVTVHQNIQGAIDKAKIIHPYQQFVIGGGEISKQFLDLGLVDKMEITRIHKAFDGDSYFPNVDWSDWNLAESSGKKHHDKTGIDFTFETYVRKT